MHDVPAEPETAAAPPQLIGVRLREGGRADDYLVEDLELHVGDHCVVEVPSGEAVGQARTKWLFAEGAQGFFYTYLLVVNPNPTATTTTVTFLPEAGGGPIVRTYPMPPMSRLVVDGSSVPEIASRSFGIVVDATLPIVAERAMYFGTTPSMFFTGGHASVGTPDPST